MKLDQSPVAIVLKNSFVAVVLTEYDDETAAADTTGAETVTYSALISSLDISFPDNDKSTFSCNLQITGVPVQATNT